MQWLGRRGLLGRCLACVALAAASVLAQTACAGPGQLPPSTSTTTTSPTTTTGGTVAPTTTQAPPTTPATVASSTTTTAPTTTTTTLPPWWRPVTAEAPLRVWVVGDSLAGPLGGALAARASASGLLTVTTNHQGGTGLVRDDVFDWPTYVAQRLPDVQPDVVVCLIGANDGQALRLPGGWLKFGTPDWDREYAGRVARFMALLAGGSARVYWVGIPIMADAEYDQRVQHMNTLQREQAGTNAQVAYTDAYSLFQGEDGQFAAQLPNEHGELVTVRLPDGIHFAAAGADRLAQEVLSRVAADWGLGDLLGS